MHIAIAYPSVCRGDEREDTINALNGILGGSMSARLFQEVREKRGLAYSVYSYVSPFNETGSHIIYAGVNPAQKQQAYDAICEVVDILKKEGVTKEEFLRSREQIKSSMFFSNENSSSQMLLYGKAMLQRDEIFDFEKRLNKINAMTYEDTREALAHMFSEENKAVALVGNTDEALALHINK